MSIKSNKGQSTLEYLILVGAVIAVAIVFLADGGLFRQTTEDTLIEVTDQMETSARDLVEELRAQQARPPAP